VPASAGNEPTHLEAESRRDRHRFRSQNGRVASGASVPGLRSQSVTFCPLFIRLSGRLGWTRCFGSPGWCGGWSGVGRGRGPHGGCGGFSESSPGSTDSRPWGAARRLGARSSERVTGWSESARGEGFGPTVELAGLGGEEGQESIGLAQRLTAASGVRTLGRSNALEPGLDACFGASLKDLMPNRVVPEGALCFHAPSVAFDRS
jgi:hypothetical protein